MKMPLRTLLLLIVSLSPQAVAQTDLGRVLQGIATVIDSFAEEETRDQARARSSLVQSAFNFSFEQLYKNQSRSSDDKVRFEFARTAVGAVSGGLSADQVRHYNSIWQRKKVELSKSFQSTDKGTQRYLTAWRRVDPEFGPTIDRLIDGVSKWLQIERGFGQRPFEAIAERFGPESPMFSIRIRYRGTGMAGVAFPTLSLDLREATYQGVPEPKTAAGAARPPVRLTIEPGALQDVESVQLPKGVTTGAVQYVVRNLATSSTYVVIAKVIGGNPAPAKAIPSVPAGTVCAYMGATAPEGWVLCDGKKLDSKAKQYSRLFGAIGYQHGGDGSSFFRVPDLRGRFLRGVSDGTGRDPDAASRQHPSPDDLVKGNRGDSVGTVQNDALQNHRHQYPDRHAWRANMRKGEGKSGDDDGGDVDRKTGTVLEARVSKETRPKNVGCFFIIKL